MRTNLLLATALLVGAAFGIGAFTFGYARGASYLSNDPNACANCHIMREQFDAWTRSSHRAVAVCNDCHAPHTLFGKYATKARNGFWHSFYFTTGGHPDPIRITPRNLEVTEGACRYCHAAVTDVVDRHGAGAHRTTAGDASGEPILCTRCHQNVGHWTH